MDNEDKGLKFTISPEVSLELVIALLKLKFISKSIEGNFKLSESHNNFNRMDTAKDHDTLAGSSLILELMEGHPSPQDDGSSLLCKNKIWEIWKNSSGTYTFVNPHQYPIREILINPSFTLGTVIGQFANDYKQPDKLLPQSLEIVLFSNWLANYGEMILHASGFITNGEAYAFLGESGAGKSTLIRSLLNQPRVTILGEDQVILRFIQGQFWIFGTPWHLDPAVCSPLGAPLKGLFFLDRNKPYGLHPIPPVKAYERILQTAFIPYYREDALERIMDGISKLIDTVSMHSLSYKLGENLLEMINADFLITT
jgi:hypothetical protein